MWTVVCRPVSDNDNTAHENRSGLAVVLVSDDETDTNYEMTRVAFVRKFAVDPDKDFTVALEEALDKAQEAADLVNETEADLERERAHARKKARERFREILGQESGTLS